ncbi:MAG: TolC family protein [Campylobacteraceae bacterium]|jgi:outer membrane protein TolC|nr:TolC family protein [Campylobacteraceae bacterium]
MLSKFVLFLSIVSLSYSADSYDFDTLANALMKTSPRQQQSDIDILVAKERKNLASSGYYPSIRISTNFEYSKKFDGFYSPSYIGEDSLTQSSGKYVSSSLYFQQEIYRFGQTEHLYNAALSALKASQAAKCIKTKDDLLLLLEAYFQARIFSHKLDKYTKIQELYTSLYIYSKRLYEAGEKAKSDTMEYARELADTASLIAGIKEDKAKYLSQILYLSGINIAHDDTLLPLTINDSFMIDIPFEKSTTAIHLMSVMKQKSLELRAQKSNYMPSFSIYGRYDLYGEAEGFNEAFRDLNKNGYRVGVSFSIPLFDGFKNEAEVNIKSFELAKSRLDYEDAKRLYEKEQALINSQILLEKERLTGANQSSNISNKLSHDGKLLYEAGELDMISLLNNEINRLKIELSEQEIAENLIFNIKKREIINTKEGQCI